MRDTVVRRDENRIEKVGFLNRNLVHYFDDGTGENRNGDCRGTNNEDGNRNNRFGRVLLLEGLAPARVY